MNPALDTAAFRFEDPFGPSADPARYVPRAATERALAELNERVIEERHSALLAGVPGIGKTLLLRILRTRFGANASVVHLRYPALPAPALFAWALQELDAPIGFDPVGALVTLASQRGNDGGEIVLLVDDAETLPEEAARALLQASRDTRGALRFVAAGDRETLGRLAGQIEATDPILLIDPMTPEETDAYIQAHLEAAGVAGAGREAFGSEAVAELHRTAGGIPARVNAEASRVLRRALGPRYTAPSARPPAERAAAPGTAPPVGLVGPRPTAVPRPDRADATSPRPAAAPAPSVPPAAAAEAAAFERAAGRLALAHQAGEATPLGDPALERAAGRLALANAEASADAGAASSPPPPSTPPAPPAEAARARPRVPAVRKPAAPPPPPRPDADRTSAPTASASPAPAKPAAPAVASVAERGRKQPPLSWAAGIFGACLAAGTLIGVRMLDAPVSEPEVRVTSVPKSAVPDPSPAAPPTLPPVSAPAPAPAPAPIPVQINATPWAEIQIDGEVVGVTPLAGVQLAPGEHRFEARFPDGEVEVRSVEIDADRRYVTFPASAADVTP